MTHTINMLKQVLAQGNPYGAASVRHLDEPIENFLDGPSDTHAFLIVFGEEDGDGTISAIRGACASYLLRKRMKFIVNCFHCNRNDVVRWLLVRLGSIPGVTPIAFSTDSTAIYQQETGAVLQRDLRLARVVASITIVTTSTPECEVTICNGEPC